MNGSIDIDNSISAAMGDIRSYVNELESAFMGSDNVLALSIQAKLDDAISSAITILTPIDYLTQTQ